MTNLDGWKRTGKCAAYGAENVGEEVVLMGWVARRRNLGGLLFLWLRDISGLIQIVFDEEKYPALFQRAEELRGEFVIAVKGEIALRTAENINPNLATGEIEVLAKELKIFSKAKTPPFEIGEQTNVREELRLKYRYLDLRRPDLQRNFILRHKIAMAARNYLDENGFLEVETPMLNKSTPEGARDYLVPSRIHPGKFYALPQSPQLFKQLLMVSGYDRYFQIVKCFRDEDLRADRQPEFTQIDMELSFVDAEDVMAINEGLLQKLFREILGKEIALPLRRMPYREAMDRFGSDKPDTRFGLELADISEIAAHCGFQVFRNAVQNGGSVRGINAKQAGFSRKEIDALGETVKEYGAKGLAWINLKPEGPASPIAKFLSQEEMDAIIQKMDGQTGDLLLFVADENATVFTALGNLRLHLGKRMGLIDESQFDLLWITEFPQFEYSKEEGRFVAMHHPFTAPMDEDICYLESDPGRVRAKAYDIVLNGNEIGGGSIRIHDAALQERMFAALGFSKEQAWNRFGFLLTAFQYGTPPHGGLAYGLDRLAMIFAGTDNIKDVIAFPKVQNASCLMTETPSFVDQKQLDELGLCIQKKEKSE